MALARVVTFEGVDEDRIDQVRNQINEGDPPEGLPDSEIIVLHDPGAKKALAILLLETEDDYRKADEVLGGMPADNTPGQRAGVDKYEVAVRRSST